MDNKKFGKVFGGVFGAALIVFGTANAGAYAVDEWVFPSAKFGDYTYIGTSDVSNLAVADAKSLFLNQAQTFRETGELHVRYLDAVAKYPLKDVDISLDETLARAESGAQNGFVFDLPESATRSFLKKQFRDVPFTEADVANIHQQLETALEGGQTVTRVDISGSNLEMKPVMVAESGFTHSLESSGAREALEALDGTELLPNEPFSLLAALEAAEADISEASDAELTEIASAIYGAVLRTNFQVDQRSVGEVLPQRVPEGEEAAINRKLGVDFAFTNPNAGAFTLNVYREGRELKASLHGHPFVHAYAISTVDGETIEPRLIKQFSAFVKSGKKVREEGQDGKRLDVVRTVTEDGFEVRVETVSSDFYPPVHRIEVHPLKQPETPAAGADGEPVPQPGDADFIDENDNGIHDPAEQSTDPARSEETDSQVDSGTPPAEPGTDSDNAAPGDNSGTEGQAADGKDQPVEYDKGGKPIRN